MIIQRSYKTELDPNVAQRILCYKSAGVARFAYNWGLAKQKAVIDQTGKRLSLNDLKKAFIAARPVDFPWAAEVSAHATQCALNNVERAFQNFFRLKRGFPVFKTRKKGVGGFRLYGCIHVGVNYIQLPTFGKIRLKEHDYLPVEGVKIVAASVSEKAGRWYVSLQVERELSDPAPRETEPVGVDLGIKSMAVLSDGTVFQNPAPLRQALRKLKHLQRGVTRKQKGSSNRRKAVRKLARAHARVANIRSNAIHQATVAITKQHGVVVVEDLKVKSMQRRRGLNQALGDAGMSEFRRQLTYKLAWTGGRLIVADRWFPSSKRCSACGQVKESLSLSERTFRCSCGFIADRDLNAALNLRSVAGKAPETLNACGEGVSGASAPVILGEAGICNLHRFSRLG